MAEQAPHAESGDDNGIIPLFLRLIDDGEQFVRAELRLYRARIFDRVRQARSAIVLLVVAFLLAQSAIVATLVGLVLVLRRALGPAGATAVVVGGALLVAAVMVWIAVMKIRTLTEIRLRADGEVTP